MYHDNKLLVNVRVYRETTCIIPVCMASKSIYFYDHDRVRWIIHMYVYILHVLYVYLLKHRIHIHSDELAESR